MHRVWIGAIATLLAVGLISTAQSQTPGRVVAIGDIHGAGGVRPSWAIRCPTCRHKRSGWQTIHLASSSTWTHSDRTDTMAGGYVSGRLPLVSAVRSSSTADSIRTSRPASVDTLNEEARKELARWDEYRENLVDGNIILPFSKFEEILTLTALELRAWVTRVSPGPQESARSVTISADDQRVIDALIAVQGVGAWSVIDPNGPLWHRGFARWSPEEGESRISKVLERFDVTRIVVGHSVTSDRLMQAKFGGRVFLIDTGMLVGAYQGRASALELVGPQATAIYIDRREPLTAPTP